MKNRLQDRVAIVTGGGHGLGRAYAKRLAEEGAKLVAIQLSNHGAAGGQGVRPHRHPRQQRCHPPHGADVARAVRRDRPGRVGPG